MGFAAEFVDLILNLNYPEDLRFEVKRLRKENEQLTKDVADARDKHSRASFHINDLVKKHEEELSTAKNETRLAVQNAIASVAADIENTKSAQAKYENDIRALRSAQVDIARAICGAVYGPDEEPVYDGDGVSMSYFHTLTLAVDRLRRQRDAIRCALNPFLPWFNHVLKTRAEEDVIQQVAVPGNLHQAAFRRRDVRVLRETLEIAR